MDARPSANPWRPGSVEKPYIELLRSVAAEGNVIGDVDLTSHWPLVGIADRRILVVGQTVYGWIPT